jgi:hypothetical protein
LLACRVSTYCKKKPGVSHPPRLSRGHRRRAPPSDGLVEGRRAREHLGHEFPRAGPQTPLGCFRGRSPAGTCQNIYDDRRARLCQTILVPVHPLRSIRRSQGRGVSRLIVLHALQLLGPTVPYSDNSAIRSRRLAASAFASESHLRSPGGITGPAGQPARPTRASSRGSPVLMHRLARGQPSPECRGSWG